MAGARSKGLARKTGMNLRPVLIYVVVAVAVAGGMYAWDLQYRRAEEARRRPPDPAVIAKNLVENIIGSGTVKDVRIDRDRKAVAVTVESTQFKPEAPRQKLRELLEAEAVLATQAVLQQLREYEQATATLVHQGKTIAVGAAARGSEKITMTYVDERLKE